MAPPEQPIDVNLPAWLTGQPSRVVHWRTGDGMNGKYASHKGQRSAQTESLLEMGYLDLLEWDWRVRSYFVQPVTIPFRIGSVTRRYTPDVFVMYEPAARLTSPELIDVLVEVKPREILHRHWSVWRPKFEAARVWCRERGVRFAIATDKAASAQRLKNIRFLLNYRGKRFVELEPHEFVMREQIENLSRSIGTSNHAVRGSPSRQSKFLNAFKSLGNRLRVPLIVAGT